MVRLTKKKAIEICRDLWRWMAETGGDKEDWSGWKKVGKMECGCPCCEYTDRMGRNESYEQCHKVCPLRGLWPDGCCDDPSPFWKYLNAKSQKMRMRCAKQIADYCDEVLGS